MLFDWVYGMFSNDLAIDLGTATTLTFVKGRGIVANEPSVVAVQASSQGPKKVLAVGKEAKEMLGRTPGNIVAIRPMKDGVIADFEVTEAMLRYFIQKAHQRRTLVRPRVIVSVPSGITEVEKRAVFDSADHVDSKETYLIHEPMAAALGIGLDVEEPVGNMVIDIGGGTTEIAVIALSGIVNDQSIRTAGDEFTNDIIDYMRRQHNLLIGERTAEQIKIHVGSALKTLDNPPDPFPVNGRDMMTGIPKQINIRYEETAEAIDTSIAKIEEAIMKALEATPPELSSDIFRTGLYLTGGGALLRGLDKRISQKVKLDVHIADDPLRAVVRGTGIALKNTDRFSFLIDRKSI